MDRDRLSASGVAVPILLVLAALDVALALYEAGWGPGLSMLPWLLMGSVLFSVFLVRSALAHWALHVASGAVGFLATVVGTAHFVFPQLRLGDAVQLTMYRLGAWAETVRLGLPSQDSLPFTFILALSLWMAFHFSTWLIYRAGRVWWAVVAPAIALMLTTYYSPDTGHGYVVIYAFCALLLIVRVSVQGLTDDWRRARIPHDRTVGEDFIVDAAYIVAAVLIIAWLLPPAALEQRAANLWVRFERPWRQVQQRWTELFPTQGGTASSAQTGLYGDSLVMGGPVRLGPEELYEVSGGPPSRMQGMIYDLYDGRQWWSTASSIGLLEPGDFPASEAFLGRVFVDQAIRVLRDTRALLAAPAPKWFDLPVKSEHVSFASQPGVNELDIYAATSRRVLAAGEMYRAMSAVSVATKEELRRAGSYYPSWLPDAYLNLPASLPQRVRDLAAEITAEASNPYDKAEAIEAYLRQLDYNTEVAAPPPGRDAVDYFLFDSREGYCNYFSSAMAVMARSVGIPARVAAGYAPGAYDAERDLYVLSASGAHAWPQLYFPRYGWVDFEPTPSQALVARPEPVLPEEETERPRPTVEPGGLDQYPPEDLEMLGGGGALNYVPPQDTPRWPLATGMALLLVAGSVLVFWYWPRRNMSAAERVYSDLVTAARLLGVRPRAYETPLEYAERVSRRIPDVSPEVDQIVRGFCVSRYGSRRIASPEDAVAMRAAWHRVLRAIGRAVPQRLSGQAA
ncbi:MAG: DUF4129 domain-containing protein [Anaerolineae bacterium]|nr:DUF4129 domain-containing protein [Anaerolineae bacterium]